MRVISGCYKGMVLLAPDGLDTRPTKEMVREALFSSLGNISGDVFLDLFSGSGAVGIEALSRGAEVFFNDKDSRAVGVIYQNLTKIGYEKEKYVSQKDSVSFLKECEKTFSIIFCDPPYAYSYKEELFHIVQTKKLLTQNGYLIYEESSRSPLQENIGDFEAIKVKKYGLSRMVYYQEKKK